MHREILKRIVRGEIVGLRNAEGKPDERINDSKSKLRRDIKERGRGWTEKNRRNYIFLMGDSILLFINEGYTQ